MKVYQFLLIGVPFLALMWYADEQTYPSEQEINDRLQRYLSDHRIIIRGKVEKLNIIDRSHGILYLDSVVSTQPYFNPFERKDSVLLYYVKDTVAELYISGVGTYTRGDSIIFNTNIDTIYTYRKGALEDAWSFGILDGNSYYDDLKEKIKKIHAAGH